MTGFSEAQGGGDAGPDAGAGPEATAEALARRLARLRFDLHDGPQQDVHLLAQDLRLFGEQLRSMLGAHPERDAALARLDELEARLVALDDGLRRLAGSLRSPLLTPESMLAALTRITGAFAARTGIVPETDVDGDLDALSDSQRIALLSLVREALANVREHSGAGHVAIAVTADDSGVRVRVRDDGRGFEPEQARERAARAGRLGLVGMYERVRMLGGRTEIESRPGGPTVVSATLPRWP